MLTLQVITHTHSARSGHPQPSTSLHGKPLSEQEHGISLAALRPAQHHCRTRHAASPPSSFEAPCVCRQTWSCCWPPACVRFMPRSHIPYLCRVYMISAQSSPSLSAGSVLPLRCTQLPLYILQGAQVRARPAQDLSFHPTTSSGAAYTHQEPHLDA